jgi:hypothetical protein
MRQRCRAEPLLLAERNVQVENVFKLELDHASRTYQ